MLYFPRWKIISVALICFIGILLSMPNALNEKTLQGLPDWLPHKQINLGLDLQGGSHLLLEIDTKDVIKTRIESVVDDVRRTMRSNRIGFTGGLRRAGRVVSVTVRKPEEFEKAYSALRALAQPVTGGLLTQLSATGAFDLNVSRASDTTIRVELTEAAINARIQRVVEQTIEILRRRIDQLGTTEPTIQQQGKDRVLVQVPGLDDPQRLKDIIGKVAKLTFRLVDTSVPYGTVPKRAPPGSEILQSVEEGGQSYLVRKRIMVAGENLVDAQPGFDQRTNQPIVSFRFDSTGARRFGRVTQANVNRPFAIVLDGKVISAPVIQEPILGGTGQISGQFTVEEVNNLAILLRAGALPAKVTFIEERTVGPGLGADSIAAGEIAAIIGMVGVLVFMIIAYGLFGVFANVSLIINILLIAGALSLLQATLTLPGIAGIVLTIGMAVDANVLIYERIREEIHAGKVPINAVDAGYSRALGTILDANITTFLAAAILFQMGSGPVRGFAVTLAIGIITSVFTAFTVNRLFVSTWLRARRPQTIPI